MAKKQKRARVARAAAGKQSARTEAAACRLREISGTPDLEAPGGSTVTIFTRDLIGTVLILSADYGGQQLIPKDQAVRKVTFTTKPGRNTLKLVFVFSAGSNGQGELREDCGDGDSHFLRAVTGGQPFQFIRILEQQP